ncbi:hypothetical protein LCGC14_2688770 [marine sediment metagenome]|uniref:Uncharacterized protein n=1 Tax=marine sediment metagenome TaxID=412755 RepID=A0A0F9CAV6_9ZZZZ
MKNKLKTLKDLFPCVMKRRTCQKRYKIICSGCRIRWELKAEAIKDIKELEKAKKDLWHGRGAFPSIVAGKITNPEEIIAYIKWKNNITAESVDSKSTKEDLA